MKTENSLRTVTALLIAHICSGCAPTVVYREPINEGPGFRAAPPQIVANGSIYQGATNRFLFEDRKARRVGDLITIILDERTVSSKSASTSASKDSGLDLPAPTLLGKVPTLNGNNALTTMSTGSSFSGSGDSQQSNSLFGNVTVMVREDLGNGNLLVSGEKELTLNNGKEIVSVEGIVRSQDISPENTVVSTLIADANIVYRGKGLIADSNRPGWLTRLFNSALWPL